ncbi:hypothetical protein [Streptomyces sp. NPDC053720]|uniref:hypothetical protein n=1 Tax=Streptomyces sp. NPDC053720 TaxID=3154855 RepID=UPI0034286FD0
MEHDGWKCRGADGLAKGPLLAAPRPLPLTEHETVAAPVETLRPWCATCWRRARKQAAEQVAELRRQQLAEAQIGLDLDLFGGAR